MFWRSHHCCSCNHHHGWRSFRRGMVAMLILIFLGLGYFDNPAHPRHASTPHPTPTHVAANHPRHHDPARHADRPSSQPGPTPRPPASHRPARHLRPRTRHQIPTPKTSLVTASQGLRWTSFHGIELPVSATAGPHDTHGGLASGFADSPQGVLLAAVNIAVRTAPDWGPAIFRPTITRQVTGPDAPALLRADERSYAQAGRTSGGLPSPQTAIEEAYRFEAYTSTAAAIDLVTTGPATNGNPVLVVTQLRVLWRRGDWRLAAPPGGTWSTASAPISSLAGYTIFPSEG